MGKGEEETHHGLGLGIERSDEVRGVLLLKPDAGAKGVARIVLEDTPGGVVDQDEALPSANVSQGEGPHDVGPDGLDLVGLAPVNVGPAGDAGGIEDVGRLDGHQVGLERRAVLQATGPVGEIDTPGLAEPPQQPADPACAAIDEELVRLVGCRGSVGWETHHR